MNRTHDLMRPALLALGLAFLAPGCEEDASGGTHSTPAPVVAKPQPTAAAALERSRQYWASIDKGDWIATYDMLTPEVQEQMPVAAYLQAKVNFDYDQVRVEEVVAQTEDHIFIRVSGVWTPLHAAAKRVKLEPGQSLTSAFEMIDIWRWCDDRWLAERRLRPEEFLEEFPDLRPKSATPSAPSDAK